MHTGVSRVRVRPECTVWELELQSELAEFDSVVGVEIQLDCLRPEKPEVHMFLPVADLTYIAADAKPACLLELEETSYIEAVACRDVVGELALGLRYGQVCSDREARRNLGTTYLRIGKHCRRKHASSAQQQ